ncbi:hypothetical protein LJR153_005982 [Paenibacillus sp. LjRoot153]|uniref:hypothetical protein n=1 Tax=Paenibacillus sp. LjRoot153 TaxID=3342270 RepID=UPI003ED12832
MQNQIKGTQLTVNDSSILEGATGVFYFVSRRIIEQQTALGHHDYSILLVPITISRDLYLFKDSNGKLYADRLV